MSVYFLKENFVPLTGLVIIALSFLITLLYTFQAVNRNSTSSSLQAKYLRNFTFIVLPAFFVTLFIIKLAIHINRDIIIDQSKLTTTGIITSSDTIRVRGMIIGCNVTYAYKLNHKQYNGAEKMIRAYVNNDTVVIEYSAQKLFISRIAR